MKNINLLIFIFSPLYSLILLYIPSYAVYIGADYFYSFILLIFYLHRVIYIHNGKINKYSRNIFLIFISFCILEFVNDKINILNYESLDIIFLKKILYNSFHGSILLLTLFLCLISTFSKIERLIFIEKYVRFSLISIPIYFILWFGINFSIIPNYSESLEINLNGFSTMIILISLYRMYMGNFKLNPIIFIASVVLLVILNSHRAGLFLILCLLVLFLLNYVFNRYKILFWISITSFFTILIFYSKLDILISTDLYYLSKEMISYLNYFDLNYVMDSNATTFNIGAEDEFSLLSRFFGNFLGLRMFFEYPISGVGYYGANSIKFIGDGIHSFSVYLIASCGIIGLLLFTIFIKQTMNFFKTNDYVLVRLFLLFYILYFQNQLMGSLILLFLTYSNSEKNESQNYY